METRSDKDSNSGRGGAVREVLPLLITGIAVIAFSTAGIAHVLGWGPNATVDAGDPGVSVQAAIVPAKGEAAARRRCPECGVIVSMREIDRLDPETDPGAAGGAAAGGQDEARVKSGRSFEIVVRMADGSIRVIEEANPARWRKGERMMVIAGSNPSPQ